MPAEIDREQLWEDARSLAGVIVVLTIGGIYMWLTAEVIGLTDVLPDVIPFTFGVLVTVFVVYKVLKEVVNLLQAAYDRYTVSGREKSDKGGS